MAFIKSAKTTFRRKVQILHGGEVAHELDVEFKYVKPRDFDAFRDQLATRKNVDAIAEIVVGWTGLKDADGNEVPCTLEAVGELLDEYWCAHTFMQEWQAGLMGAREKN